MTAGMAITSENVRKELQQSETRAAQLFVDAEKVKGEIIESGVNPLGASTEEQAAFQKVDEAYKAYDTERERCIEMKGKLDRLSQIDGMSGGANIPGASPTRPYPGPSERRSLHVIGARFVDSPEYQSLKHSGAFSSDTAFAAAMARGLERPVEILSREELGTLLQAARFGATTVTGGGATSAGPFIQNDLIPGFVAYRRKRPLLSSLVNQGETDSDVVEWISQSAPTDAAAETAEDSAAPESALPFATNTVNVEEITHFVPVTNRAMADAGQMRTIVEQELILGALDRLDTQIASGNGTGNNLEGIYTATTQTQAAGGLNKSEALHKAITKVRIAAGVLAEPDNIGLHPNDYEKLVLEQDAQGNYIFGPPSQQAPRTCWGVPLVGSTVFTSGTPLVGDYEGSARLWLRQALAVTAGLDGNDFTKRRISLLAAIRVAFKVIRAGGFCEVTGF